MELAGCSIKCGAREVEKAMDWQTVIAVGALVVAAVGVLSRAFDKSLSIREHEEFRNSIRLEMDRLRHNYERETNRLEDRLTVLETTRPTTGELEARLRGSGIK